MSKAEQFRRATEEFWSKMDQKGRPAAGARKPTLTRSGNSDSGNRPRGRSALAIAAPARKTKKRTKR
jgi:hypothetical protein